MVAVSRGGEEGAPGRGTLPCSHSPPVSLCQVRKGMSLRAAATRLAPSSLRRRHGHLLPAAATSFSTPLFLVAPSLVACLPLTVRLIPRQDSSRCARTRRASWFEIEKMFRRGAAGGAAEVQAPRGGRSRRSSGEVPAEQERFMGGGAGEVHRRCPCRRTGNIFWWVRRPRARFAVTFPPPPILSGLRRILLNLGRAIPVS